MGKGEIAHNKQFLLFPQCFLLNQIIVSPFVHIFDISLFAPELEEPKIGILGKGLKLKAFPGDKINVAQKLKFFFWKNRKHCGKRRKCWLPAFF